ncbi:MAG: hypothetical protein P8L44_08725 [Opitutales bacterium]|nr:hypothetical protein [Opitutales bacterium]
MKAALCLIYVTVAMLCLSGCSYPLMISLGGQKHVAPVLGVEEEAVEFIQYGYYNENPRGEGVSGKEGIIVLTDESLALIEGLLSTMDGTPDVVLPISELDGVHLGKYQLQLKRGRERVVIWVVRVDLTTMDLILDCCIEACWKKAFRPGPVRLHIYLIQTVSEAGVPDNLLCGDKKGILFSPSKEKQQPERVM